MLAPSPATAGGVLGALIGTALRGELPRPAGRPRPPLRVASLALVAVLADGLYETAPPPVRAALTIAPAAEAGGADVARPARPAPPRATTPRGCRSPRGRAADGSSSTGSSATAGGWRTTRPIPVDGDWKVQLRLQTGRHVIGVPVRLPADPAIPPPRSRPRRA